jgi:hypothetical protein
MQIASKRGNTARLCRCSFGIHALQPGRISLCATLLYL